MHWTADKAAALILLQLAVVIPPIHGMPKTVQKGGLGFILELQSDRVYRQM